MKNEQLYGLKNNYLKRFRAFNKKDRQLTDEIDFLKVEYITVSDRRSATFKKQLLHFIVFFAIVLRYSLFHIHFVEQ